MDTHPHMLLLQCLQSFIERVLCKVAVSIDRLSSFMNVIKETPNNRSELELIKLNCLIRNSNFRLRQHNGQIELIVSKEFTLIIRLTNLKTNLFVCG